MTIPTKESDLQNFRISPDKGECKFAKAILKIKRQGSA